LSHQLALRVLEEDLRILEDELRQRSSVFVAYYHDRPIPTLCSALARDQCRQPLVWLAREEDLELISLNYISAQGYWLVDQIRSPVLELSRGGMDESRLVPGRLYYRTGYYDGPEWVGFSPEFLEWADGIFRFVRRRFPYSRETRTYDGVHAKEWLSAHS
jgi:hypothetical protein